MRKAFTAIAALCALMAGAALMQLKLAVQEQAERVAELADQIHDDQETLRILEAEWAYLTSPQFLQEQSIEFLALMPPHPRQVLGDFEEIPMRRRDEKVQSDQTVLLPQPDSSEPIASTVSTRANTNKDKPL